MKQYRCVAGSPEGFVQQLVRYITAGYHFYVTGVVPERKEPAGVDSKLISKYFIDLGRSTELARQAERSRRKGRGVANVQYLRYERFFVLMATVGRHRFFSPKDAAEDSGESVRDPAGVERRIRDIRESAIKFAGYSISKRPSANRGSWHAHVRIDLGPYRELKAHLVELGRRRTIENLREVLAQVPFEPYFPVRKQLLNILRAVNRERKSRGFKPVPVSALRLRRRSVKVFEEARRYTRPGGAPPLACGDVPAASPSAEPAPGG